MHILITGAAGMIGRKLAARLVGENALGGRPIEKLTLLDVSARQRPDSFPARGDAIAADVAVRVERSQMAISDKIE